MHQRQLLGPVYGSCWTTGNELKKRSSITPAFKETCTALLWFLTCKAREVDGRGDVACNRPGGSSAQSSSNSVFSCHCGCTDTAANAVGDPVLPALEICTCYTSRADATASVVKSLLLHILKASSWENIGATVPSSNLQDTLLNVSKYHRL